MRVVWFIIAGLWYVGDYVTKEWAKSELVNRTIEVNAFLEWRLAFNHGAAFSFLSNQNGWQKWFFIAVAVAVSLWLIVELIRNSREKILYPLALASILGGALGNLVDRVMHGKVTDFIHAHYHQHSWPIFNIADVAISVGVGLILLDWAFGKK